MSNIKEQGFQRRWYTKAMNWYRWSPVYLPFFNEAARVALQTRYFLERTRVQRFCKNKQGDIDQWIDSLNMFFGFSSGRGGTVFLSNMLKIEIAKSHIEHEANVIDYWELPKARNDEKDSLAYVKNFRKQEIYYRSPHNIDVYGEINPYIRRHCSAFKTVFPKAKFFHMVRDPRDVVRSIMAREILGKKDPMSKLILPQPGDAYHQRWSEMSRFERVCWEWQDDNKYMREQVPHFIRFEDMMSDYGVFKSELLDFLGFEISEDVWSHYVSTPRNVSRKHTHDHWASWDKNKLRTFTEICGEEMAMYGYTF